LVLSVGPRNIPSGVLWNFVKEAAGLLRKLQREGIGPENGTHVNGRWKTLCACRDFRLLLDEVCPDVLDLFEKQITEYLAMTELTESYLREVPRSVCWYEGLISTEMLLMELL